MKKIITISREYGSGGRTIGQIVAKQLDYTFYDKELIDIAAKESGLAPEFIEKTEQNLSSGWLYNMMLGSGYAIGTAGSPPGAGNPILPLADQVFNAQREVILQIARKGPCIIVGRCADFILERAEDIPAADVLNVFIYANLEARIKRAVTEYGVPADAGKRIVTRIDKRRANHYNTFTENIWGNRKNYDLMINSAYLGVNGTADIIVTMAKEA